MASRTDLSGFLRDDTPSLQSLLHAAIQRGELERAWKARGNFQTFGTSATPCVCEAVGEGLTVAGIDNLLNDLERQIIEKVGYDPRGKLRLRIYERGQSATPNVDHTRLLDVKIYDSDDDNPAQLRAALTEERNENHRLREMNVGLVTDLARIVTEQHGQMALMSSSSMKSLAEVATVRAQVGAAGEAGQLHSAVGLLVLFLGLPFMREMFDLPDNVPVSQIVAVAVERFKLAFFGKGENVSTPKQVPQARRMMLENGAHDTDGDTDERLELQDDDDDTDEVAEPGGPPEPEVILTWLRDDPAWGRRVYQTLMGDAALIAQLMG